MDLWPYKASFEQPRQFVVLLRIDRSQVDDDAIVEDAGDDGRIQRGEVEYSSASAEISVSVNATSFVGSALPATLPPPIVE